MLVAVSLNEKPLRTQIVLVDDAAEREEVLSVFESKTNILHTTHSWDFLGVSSSGESYPMAPYSDSDVIVGSIDTGKNHVMSDR